MDEVKLLPCPFCENEMTIRSGVNPMARCDTEGCWMHERHIGLALDDPSQVAAWNTRPTLVTGHLEGEGK